MRGLKDGNKVIHDRPSPMAMMVEAVAANIATMIMNVLGLE